MENRKNYPSQERVMSPDECHLFYSNYKYMWDSLGTSPYRVQCSKKPAYTADNKRIQGVHLLPAYSICSRCFHQDPAISPPSKGSINKIVQIF